MHVPLQLNGFSPCRSGDPLEMKMASLVGWNQSIDGYLTTKHGATSWDLMGVYGDLMGFNVSLW